ncbi:MAG: tripartite tricarboxylate transporter substrate binding protein, partial [Gammaproteobacteria bacterium]|nr:tripartite tricarboxylate transporter substrate binding protein [Gammaproteobacteria bacterium]
MKRRGLLRWTLAVLAVTGALLPAGCAREGGSGEYPSKPVTIVVPYAPGGGGDTFTRAVAAQAADILGVKVFVENRTGGGGTIGVGSVARAAADGYTLAFVSTSPVVMAPNFLDVPYDPLEDFTYLARFVVSVHPVLVGGESPFDSFPAVLEFARANPGRLRWSTAGINGAPHVATLAAFRQEGVEATFVPMQGSSEVLAGLLGGTIDLGVISDYSGALAAGDVRVLAEIGAEPIPGLP